MQGVVRAQRNNIRHDHYATLAEHWLAMSELHLPSVETGRAIWTTPLLEVSIRPDFAVVDETGNMSVIKLWLKEQELGTDAARAILRLLDLHMPELLPEATPIVVDVRREKIHRKNRRPVKQGYDAWMESEARGLAELWSRLTAA